jgi:DNA repair protein RadA/Sms
MYAARQGSLDATRALLAARADPDLGDPEGTTALMLAISNAHFEVAELLIEQGADPDVADVTGMTALYAAVDMSALGALPGRPAPVPSGPRVLEHIVDTVLYLEGDHFQAYRLLRSVKNRFGATSEVGVFEMLEGGLSEVTNPSEAFLAERMINAAGSAIAVTMEGTRPILVEVQGLTSPTQFGNARRTANGIDFNRLLLISAVLTRRAGFKLSEQDIFVNVVGGLQIDEPAADLAVAAAIASSWKDVSVKADAVLIGEIGLAGELRMPGQMQARLKEASKLGFKTAIVPKAIRKSEEYPKGIQVIEVRSVQEALSAALKTSDMPKARKVA